MTSPPKKRRKKQRYNTADKGLAGLKILKDVEKTDPKLALPVGNDEMKKELWFFQLPKDVSFIDW